MDLSKLRAREARKAENDRFLAIYQQELKEAEENVKRFERYMIEEWGDVMLIAPPRYELEYGKDSRKLGDLRRVVERIKNKMRPLENYIDEDDIREIVMSGLIQ
jgi:hypothetical protein